MSINHSGGASSSPTTSLWQDIMSARSRSVQELANLKVGEAQAARVHALLSAAGGSGESPQAASSRIVLEIGGRMVELRADIRVQPGDLLQLELQANGQLLIKGRETSVALASALRFLPADSQMTFARPAPGMASGFPTQTYLQDALSKVLPFQGRLLESLGPLLQLQASGPQRDLQPRLELLRALIPSGQDLATPTGLKQALQQSGAFAEKLLLADKHQAGSLFRLADAPDKPRDLKLALLSLFASLARSPQAASGTTSHAPAAGGQPLSPRWQPASNHVPQPLLFPHPEFLKAPSKGEQQKADLSTGELLKLVAQALTRIQTNQLNSIQQGQSGPDGIPVNTWLVELPAWSGSQLSLFQVRIEEHQQQEEQPSTSERKQESLWRITLSFNLDPLGPLYSLVRIQRGKVSSTFWAEADSTLKLLEQELPQLHKALAKLGLDVEFLEAMPGQPSFTQTRLDTQLIDVRT